MASTLLLDTESWDLVPDILGNIAVATEPYALAQDAASEIRTFTGDCYYDQTRGIPYFQQILGQVPPVSLMKAKFIAAAERVPDVVSARCFIASIEDRAVRGQVQVFDAAGEPIAAAGF